MSFLRQVFAITAISLGTLRHRPGTGLVTLIGVACVVTVLISLLAIGAGVRRAVDVTSQPERAVILSGSAPNEFMGAFTPADIAQIAQAPGIRLDAQGRPMVQPLGAVLVEVVSRKDGAAGNLMFRGTGEIGDEMNQASLRIVEGRRFRAGLHELVVGRAAQKQYRNLGLGDTITLRGIPWKVVGVYENQGGWDENSIAGDVDTLLAAFGRNAYQSVGVMLNRPSDFRRFRDALMSNPQLSVTVKTLPQYYKDQARGVISLFDFVGYFVGAVMAVGAVFGAITTMYSVVDSRVREIATVRALGYRGGAVVAAVMIESLVLALPGALIGVGLAWVLFNQHDISTGGVTFALSVTPALTVTGVVWALAIGLIGGLAPSIRAARLPVASALRAT